MFLALGARDFWVSSLTRLDLPKRAAKCKGVSAFLSRASFQRDAEKKRRGGGEGYEKITPVRLL